MALGGSCWQPEKAGAACPAPLGTALAQHLWVHVWAQMSAEAREGGILEMYMHGHITDTHVLPISNRSFPWRY